MGTLCLKTSLRDVDMLQKRVMPCLLLNDASLVKTRKFKDPTYIGDPINAVRIYNEKEVDEIIILDIIASKKKMRPQFELISDIVSEAFMPITYGGGICDMEDMKKLYNIGLEKISINSFAFQSPNFIERASKQFGSQSIVLSIDVQKNYKGDYEVITFGGTNHTGIDPVTYAIQMEALGAGEILLTSIDRDGTQEGYDIDLIMSVSEAVDIPVIASGGAGKISDFGNAVNTGGASACAIGSMAVYYGRNRAVMINFPRREALEKIFLME